jgi:hypothetical protein
MGGHAIKTVKVERLSKAIYKKIIQEITDSLSKLPVRFAFTFETPGKEDFGDVDVLIDTTYGVGTDETKIQELIHSQFHTVEWVKNGYVLSFAYEKDGLYYQVDFILIKCLEMAQMYFSYGDCGAIVGRYAAAHGLTFSEDGLLIKIKGSYLFEQKSPNNDTIIHTITLSSDPQEVCDYLGLDFFQWQTGFQSVEEIYEWIISSRFFNKKFYQFLKIEHRRRLKSFRNFYVNFLHFIQIDWEQVNNIDLKFELSGDEKYRHVMEALKSFLHKLEEFRSLENEILLKQERKRKFNCNVFLENGISQSRLYEVMKLFKKWKNMETGSCDASIDEQDDGRDTVYQNYEVWLDTSSEEEVRKEVCEWVEANRSSLIDERDPKHTIEADVKLVC